MTFCASTFFTFVTKFVKHLERSISIFTERRSKVGGNDTKNLEESVFKLCDFKGQFSVSQSRDVGMGPGVVSNLMARLIGSEQEILVGKDVSIVLTVDEERSFDVVLVEVVDELLSVLIRTIVKSNGKRIGNRARVNGDERESTASRTDSNADTGAYFQVVAAQTIIV